ncbi:hypothetical protein PO551_24255, partial [Escherichia coli]
KRVFLVILFTSFSGSLVSRISGAVHFRLCNNPEKTGRGKNPSFRLRAPQKRHKMLIPTLPDFSISYTRPRGGSNQRLDIFLIKIYLKIITKIIKWNFLIKGICYE